MSNSEYVNDLTLDDLHEKYRWIAELIGMDKLILFCETAGGTYHYIPQTRQLVKNLKYKAIIEEFDGFNIKQLVEKYKTSESTIRRLVGNQIAAKKKSPLEGQLSLY